jgi:predicted dinucleotide-binding enzyme
MQIGVLGTGMVGQTIGTKLIELGHDVMLGSRTASNEKSASWVKAEAEKGINSRGTASGGTFEESAGFGELVFNCTSGSGTLEALSLAGAANLNGKVLIDVSNPLDFSKGMPPTLIASYCNTTSLGEEIQKIFPEVKVVKSLNTMNCKLMVNASFVPGDHDVFLCGNDADAKEKVKEILGWFGWKSPIDLGDISAARGTEMILPLWLRLMGTYKTANFNFKVVRIG